ncbi:MAG: T9SS type A sorting domain-containing protein [Candidatus Delongbacteria bacterium]|jgi:hypothetical protein|nr:T9SS type A sorting domain-containing protein [Candidatus Delongbacteria bacterium]
MKKIIQLIVFLFVMSTALFGLTWEQMFPELNSYSVTEIKRGSITNVSNYGYVFGLNRSEMAYYTSSDLKIISPHNTLPLVSYAFKENVTDTIICVVGNGSNSDAMYKHNTADDTTYFAGYTIWPIFLKKLASGFYYAKFTWTSFSKYGVTWESLDHFRMETMSDIEETGSGTVFYGGNFYGGGTLYMQTPDSIVSYSTGTLDINDIYVRRIPNNNEVLVTLGTGSLSDGLYKVNYNDSTITGVELIDWISGANLITEYEDSYIVTTNIDMYPDYIFIVPFDTGIARYHEHGLDIDEIYCIEDQYPIYTPNFMIGTDKGVFMCTGTTSIDNEQLTIDNCDLQQNYPNPFNNETMIPFKLDTGSEVSIIIFNTNGKQVKQVFLGKMNKGTHEYKLSTDNFTSGQYFYSLSINGEVKGRNKMLYLR